MVRLQVITALMTGLAAAACASGAQLSTSDIGIDQSCAETASTGGSYRYCMQPGLEQAALAQPASRVGTSALALRAE